MCWQTHFVTVNDVKVKVAVLVHSYAEWTYFLALIYRIIVCTGVYFGPFPTFPKAGAYPLCQTYLSFILCRIWIWTDMKTIIWSVNWCMWTWQYSLCWDVCDAVIVAVKLCLAGHLRLSVRRWEILLDRRGTGPDRYPYWNNTAPSRVGWPHPATREWLPEGNEGAEW